MTEKRDIPHPQDLIRGSGDGDGPGPATRKGGRGGPGETRADLLNRIAERSGMQVRTPEGKAAAKRAILELCRRRVPFSPACRLGAGINESTGHKWRRADPGFDREVRLARAQVVARSLERIERHAADEWTADAWFLERTDGETFGRKDGRQAEGTFDLEELVLESYPAGQLGDGEDQVQGDPLALEAKDVQAVLDVGDPGAQGRGDSPGERSPGGRPEIPRRTGGMGDDEVDQEGEDPLP